MADDSEEKPSAAHDIASKKASILDTLNQLRKWREEQLAECRKNQFIESQKSLQLPKDNQKQFEQLLENEIKHRQPGMEDKSKENVPEVSDVSSISLAADLDICDTLQESSITGHLQRCFNDSTPSDVSVSGNKVLHAPEKVPVFSELRNPQFSDKNPEEKCMPLAKTGLTNGALKPKRPFLRKGSGLLRFMPKSTSSSQTSIDRKPPKVNKFQVKKDQLPQKTLKLKPALRKPDVPSEKVKHIRFDVTDSNDEEDIEAQLHNDLPSVSQANEINSQEKNRENPSNAAASISPENNKSDISLFGSESLNLSKESKELEEFEMLENYAQNSSFNSDSSLVQRIVQGESGKPSCANENYSSLPSQNMTSSSNTVHINPPENLNCPEKISLNTCLEEISARKQMLHDEISGIHPRIESLQKEILYDKKEYLDDSDISDRCSTPVNFEDKNPISECDSNISSSVLEISPEVQTNHFMSDPDEVINPSDCTCCNADDAYDKFYPVPDHEHICSDKEECTCNYPDEAYENEVDCNEKSKIRSKLLELQNEIERYQQLNCRLSSAIKEKNDVMRKLQKERDDFCKYKETELQKLEARIQEERRQIKRQKETFNRLQKLRKDNPTKKERDELSSLRSEVEKLHDDLKRQKIKYNNDSRRWKTRLENAEKEKDTFKLENIRLEEQCQDLLATLKARMKKNIKCLDDECNHIHNDDSTKLVVEKKDAECQTEEKNVGFNTCQDSGQTSPKSADVKKSKTHFGLFSGFEKDNVGVIDKDLNVPERDVPKNGYFHSEQNDLISKSDNNRTGDVEKTVTDVNLSVISVSCDTEFKEINNGNSIERIHSSGEREIIYKSGTRKVISPDGKSKKLFFHNGDIKEMFPDGLIIYTYNNGVIETTLPDDTKITKFPNGQIQSHHPNGTKEVKFPDGTVQNILPDGSEEIRTVDGNIVKNQADGTKVIELSNGQREIITRTYKKREFPNGSVKIIYHDGKQETRYSNGRVKIKDKDGRIIFDTKYISTTKS